MKFVKMCYSIIEKRPNSSLSCVCDAIHVDRTIYTMDKIHCPEKGYTVLRRAKLEYQTSNSS